jgi:GNAT superfamily N-acetyltransferase
LPALDAVMSAGGLSVARALRVRMAGEGDAGGIAAVHVRAWQAGYRELLPDALLDALSVGERELQWRERLSGASPEWVRTLVAVELADAADPLVGFCSLAAPSRDADAGPRTAEIAALYVAPERWGEGIGEALMHATFELLACRGGRWELLTLWMLEGNDRALAFYSRFGFAPDGARRDDTLTGPTGQRAAAPHIRLSAALS